MKQDNDTKLTLAFIKQKRCKMLNWSSQSSDLNPTEQGKNNKTRNKGDLLTYGIIFYFDFNFEDQSGVLSSVVGSDQKVLRKNSRVSVK